MQILLYEWNAVGQKDLEDCLIHIGNKVDKIRYIFQDFENDLAFEQKITELLLLKRYDCVISFNYFQVISKVCCTFHMKYIAWVWDSPLINIYSKTVYNSCNYIFIFDKTMYAELKKMNVNTVYYLPLATNVDRLDTVILSEEEQKEYSAEVSFVGNLYEKRNHYNEIPVLPDYLRGYFDGIMRSQVKIHGYNFIEEMLTEDITEELFKFINFRMGDNFTGSTVSLFADRFLNAKITEMERRSLLSKLSEHFNVTLYTRSNTSDMPHIHNKGYADYITRMPKVFKGSRINLNFTSRTIKSGIPLRVFDVLGAGGFLITNYQSELQDYFEIGRDLVCYENEEDLLYKVQYYLEHEEERKEIAYNGYRKVKEHHSYETKLWAIMSIVFNLNSNLDNKVIPALLNSQGQLTEENKKEIVQVKEEIKSYVAQGYLEKAMGRYYSASREMPLFTRDNEVSDLSVIFEIYNYELKEGIPTLFDNFLELDKLYTHFSTLKNLIKDIETQKEKSFEVFLDYIDNNRVSYIAIEFIIREFIEDKVNVLNEIALMFLENKRNNMVIPFLALAYEINSDNTITLYNLGNVLFYFGEYEMATEYLSMIKRPSEEVIKILEKAKEKI